MVFEKMKFFASISKMRKEDWKQPRREGERREELNWNRLFFMLLFCCKCLLFSAGLLQKTALQIRYLCLHHQTLCFSPCSFMFYTLTDILSNGFGALYFQPGHLLVLSSPSSVWRSSKFYRWGRVRETDFFLLYQQLRSQHSSKEQQQPELYMCE